MIKLGDFVEFENDKGEKLTGEIVSLMEPYCRVEYFKGSMRRKIEIHTREVKKINEGARERDKEEGWIK